MADINDLTGNWEVFPEPGLQNMIVPSLKLNPEQVGKDALIAEDLDIHPTAISDKNRPDLETEQRSLLFEQQLKSTKILKDLVVTDPDGTLGALIQDDLSNTVSLEKSSREMSFTGKWSEGVSVMESLGWRFAETVAEVTDYDADAAAFSKLAQEALKDVTPVLKVEDIDSPEAFWSWMVEASGQQLPLMLPSLIGTVVGGAIGSIVPVVGTGIGLIIGNRLGAFIPSFILGTGEVQQAIKHIDPTVEAPGIAFLGGALIGALDSLLPGRIGRKLVEAFGVDVTQEVLRLTAKEILKKAGRAGLEGITVEGITEAIQTAIEHGAASIATDTEIDVPALTSEMLNAFAIGAFMGGTIGTVTTPVTERIKARKAKKMLDALNIMAKDSKLRQRNTRKFGEAVGAFLNEGGTNQFIIDTDILIYWAEQHTDRDILALLDVADQLDNPQVVLSPETFSAFILGTEAYDKLSMFVQTPAGDSMDSVSKVFSDLEYVASLKAELEKYPIPDALKEKVLKTLDKFENNPPATVFDEAEVDVNAIISGLMTEIEGGEIIAEDAIQAARLEAFENTLIAQNTEIIALEEQIKEVEKAGKSTVALGKKLDTALARRAKTLTDIDALEQPEQERLEDAAIQLVTGEIFTGTDHGDAIEKAIDELGEGILESEVAPLRGWMTSEGRFVLEAEAEIIAKRAGQVAEGLEGGISSEDLAAAREEQVEKEIVREVHNFNIGPEGNVEVIVNPSKKDISRLALESQKRFDELSEQTQKLILGRGPIDLLRYSINPETGAVIVWGSDLATHDMVGRALGLPDTAEIRVEQLGFIRKVDGVLKAINEKGDVNDLTALLPKIKPAPKKEKPKKVITSKIEKLLNLAVKANMKAIRLARKAFNAGVNSAKTLAAKQKAAISAIDKMALTPKQKLALNKRISAIETLATFNRKAGLVAVSADKMVLRQHQIAVIKAIKKQLEKTKVRGKEGQFSPEVQEYLDEVNKIMSLPRKKSANKETIRQLLDARLLDPNPDPDEAWKQTLYTLLLGDETLNMVDAENLLLDIAAIKASGKASALIRVQTRRHRRDADITMAKEGILSGKNPEMIDTSKLAFKLNRWLSNVKAGTKDALLESWSGILDIMINVAGFDASAVMENLQVTDEIQSWKADNIKWEEQLLDAYRDIYGLANNNQALNRMVDDHTIKSRGVFEDKNGREVNLLYSVAQIRKLWMERQDPKLRDVTSSKQGNAYTEEMFTALWASLDGEGKDYAFAEAQLEIYRNLYNSINKVYRRMYGVNLPFNEFYSPVVRDRGVAVEGMEEQFGGEETIIHEMSFRRSFPKALLKRKLGEVALGKQHDIDTIYQHIHNMSWFIHMAEKTLHIQNVFKNEPLRKAIRLQYGHAMLSNVDGWIEDFRVGHIKKGNSFNQIISGINKRFSQSVLTIKPTLLIKQLTSWFAMADGIPGNEFLASQADFLKLNKDGDLLNAAKIMRFLYKNSAGLQTRGSSVGFDIAQLGQIDQSVFTLKNKHLWKTIGFAPIRVGDRIPIYMGMWAIYQHNIKKGVGHKQAMAAAERAMNETQQSTDLDKLSPVQRDYAIGRTLTMFMSSRLSLIRGEIRAWRQSPLPIVGRNKISWFDFGKRIGYYHFAMPMLIQWIASGFKWEDDRQLVAAVAGQLNSFIILGDFMLRAITDILVEEADSYEIDTDIPLIDILNELYRGLRTVAEDPWDAETLLDASNDLGSVAGKIIGLPIDQALNILGGMGDIADDEMEKGLKRILGFTEEAAEKSIQ